MPHMSKCTRQGTVRDGPTDRNRSPAQTTGRAQRSWTGATRRGRSMHIAWLSSHRPARSPVNPRRCTVAPLANVALNQYHCDILAADSLALVTSQCQRAAIQKAGASS
jgi:hypothetical protein